MIIQWPANKNVGDIYVSPVGSKWKWTGKAWTSMGATGSSGNVGINSITYQFAHSPIDPVDNMIYYIGDIGDSPPQSNSTKSRRIKSSFTGKVREITISTQITGNLGSNENQIFRLNNFTTNNHVDIITDYKNLNISQLNVYTLSNKLDVNKGDELEIIWEVGIFSNSPTLVRHSFNIYIEF